MSRSATYSPNAVHKGQEEEEEEDEKLKLRITELGNKDKTKNINRPKHNRKGVKPNPMAPLQVQLSGKATVNWTSRSDGRFLFHSTATGTAVTPTKLLPVDFWPHPWGAPVTCCPRHQGAQGSARECVSSQNEATRSARCQRAPERGSERGVIN